MAQILFWPFIIASILISLIGIYFKKSYFLLISALLIVPLALYLAATPRFSLRGLILPLFYIGSYLALKKNKLWSSLLIVTPVYILIGWFAYINFTS